jgi:AraC family transcriptional regulator
MNRLQGLNRCARRGDRHDLERAGECIWSALQSKDWRRKYLRCSETTAARRPRAGPDHCGQNTPESSNTPPHVDGSNIQFRPTYVRFSPSQASGPARGLGSQRSNHQIKGCSILAGNGSRDSTRGKMNASRSIVPSEKLAQFCLKPGPAVATTETRYSVDQPLQAVATGLAELLETARQELEHDRELAKASLIAASDILHAEIERLSGAKDFQRGCLVAWQVVRVRDYVDGNLHRPIHVRDLCAVARLSPAHFSRKFKLSFGETPLVYVARMRLKKACHLMITSKATLSEIALRAGFSDQAHLCRQFKRAFSQSPATWRRELDLHAGRCSFVPAQADRLNRLSEGVALVDRGPEYEPDASGRREC